MWTVFEELFLRMLAKEAGEHKMVAKVIDPQLSIVTLT